MFKDAVTFPLREKGWIMILLGAVMAAILTFASALPLLGRLAAIFSASYFAAFYFEITASTITGHDRCPDWPGFSNL